MAKNKKYFEFQLTRHERFLMSEDIVKTFDFHLLRMFGSGHFHSSCGIVHYRTIRVQHIGNRHLLGGVWSHAHNQITERNLLQKTPLARYANVPVRTSIRGLCSHWAKRSLIHQCEIGKGMT